MSSPILVTPQPCSPSAPHHKSLPWGDSTSTQSCCELISDRAFAHGVLPGHASVLAGHDQCITPIAPVTLPKAPTHPCIAPLPQPCALAAPPPPPARAGPACSRWLCLAARCWSRRASRPGCAGPNRMIRLGAPRLLPAPRRREQIRSDGSHLWPPHCPHQPSQGAHVGWGGVVEGSSMSRHGYGGVCGGETGTMELQCPPRAAGTPWCSHRVKCAVGPRTDQHPHPVDPSFGLGWGWESLGHLQHPKMPSALSSTCQSLTVSRQDISVSPGPCWDRAMG